MSIAVKKSAPPDTSSYRVCLSRFGVYVVGNVPVNEAAALLSCWHAAGLEWLATDVAKEIDAAVAVCNTESDAKRWLKSVSMSNSQDDDYDNGPETRFSSDEEEPPF